LEKQPGSAGGGGGLIDPAQALQRPAGSKASGVVPPQHRPVSDRVLALQARIRAQKAARDEEERKRKGQA